MTHWRREPDGIEPAQWFWLGSSGLGVGVRRLNCLMQAHTRLELGPSFSLQSTGLLGFEVVQTVLVSLCGRPG